MGKRVWPPAFATARTSGYVALRRQPLERDRQGHAATTCTEHRFFPHSRRSCQRRSQLALLSRTPMARRCRRKPTGWL